MAVGINYDSENAVSNRFNCPGGPDVVRKAGKQDSISGRRKYLGIDVNWCATNQRYVRDHVIEGTQA